MAASVCQLWAVILLPRGLRILRSLSSRGSSREFAVVIAGLAFLVSNLYIQLLNFRRDARGPSTELLTAGQAIASAGVEKAGPRDHLALAPGAPGQKQARRSEERRVGKEC